MTEQEFPRLARARAAAPYNAAATPLPEALAALFPDVAPVPIETGLARTVAWMRTLVPAPARPTPLGSA